jgi:stage V sporulation protein R
MFQVRAEDDDISFILNYLSDDLVEDMNLFTYGLRGKSEDPDSDDIILKSRKAEQVRNIITEKLHNNGAPLIYVLEASSGTLVLEHDPLEEMPLDPKYAKETLKYVRAVWKNNVVLKTKDRYSKAFEYRASQDGVIMVDSNGDEMEVCDPEEAEEDQAAP